MFKIGRIVKPRKLDWLTDDKIEEYLESMGWQNLENSVINGFIWISYLNEYDYKNVYLNDVENSKDEIIKQILEQLKREY